MHKNRYHLLKTALGVLAFLLPVLSSACATLNRPDSIPAAVKQAGSNNFDWLQFNGNPQHDGNNASERNLTPANVTSLKKLFQVYLPGIADGSPVYLSKVSTREGIKNILFLNTTNGTVLAVDAQTGDFIWQRDYPPDGCKVNNGSQDCYTTSSSAVDPNRQFIYAYGLDGKVHKLKVGDGTEITSGGWPETVTLKPYDEKGSSALAVATAKDGNSYLYVATSGYLGDQGDYQGHITSINLSSGTQQTFNTLCSNQGVHFAGKPQAPDCAGVKSGIWARPGVVYDPATNRIYAATGNGNFAPSNYEWGDSVIALKPDGTGISGGPLDSYTPDNYQQLSDQDLDLGSTAPAILPVPANSKVKNLAVQSGKDGMLRLLDLDNLSGKGSPGNTGGEFSSPMPVPQGGAVLTQPAVWVNPQDQSTWIFITNGSGISAMKLVVDEQGNPALGKVWVSPDGGTSPIVANSVLYVAATGVIRAIDPLTGALLWKNNSVGRIHWSSPILANGVLYITDESGHLTAFTLEKG